MDLTFTDDGPLPDQQKKTVKWEPSTEKMYVRDGVLKGDVNMVLLLEGELRRLSSCQTITVWTIALRLQKQHDKDYNKIKLYEHAEGHSGLPRQAK
ncbi:GFP-like fluorescent chromoprotein cFP484 [Orbicella faveolata]|uniref:GFP-like fluorescent chromoprotein cFP484 n=1 Tax=Orbicella faveolata TaxID=48498 RepID=UPI0009E562D6|nr:GFP-like fluorescent chromoprotein cFP484 [Orbicella faveolata]